MRTAAILFALVGSALLLAATRSEAQPFPGTMLADKDDTFTRYVTTEGNRRIGRNAALVEAYEVASAAGAGIGSRLILSCDGSWTLGPIAMKVESIERGQAFVKRQLDPGVPDVTESAVLDEPSYDWVKKHAKRLCVNLQPEPTNLLIPVSRGRPNSKGLSFGHAVVAGTAVRRGDRVEVWTRGSEFREKVTTDADGKQRKERTATGRYLMDRDVYDCKQRSMGTTQRVEYGPDGDNRTERGALTLEAVVPGSQGETLLNTVCMLY